MLEAEAGTRNAWLAFSADGRRLAAFGASDVGPTVWDLATIRDELRRLGFDLP